MNLASVVRRVCSALSFVDIDMDPIPLDHHRHAGRPAAKPLVRYGVAFFGWNELEPPELRHIGQFHPEIIQQPLVGVVVLAVGISGSDHAGNTFDDRSEVALARSAPSASFRSSISSVTPYQPVTRPLRF